MKPQSKITVINTINDAEETMATTTLDLDAKLSRRIESSIKTVKAWDEEVSLLAECRSQIPWEALRDDSGPFSKPDDYDIQSSDARFLQRLTRFFQKSMTWVNKPPCVKCSSADGIEQKYTRDAETDEEIEGLASRVEVYHCKTCSAQTLFPRFNSTRTLLKTRKGRCGEFANLFGFFCRAAGFETRYIHDVTDHVWVEVLIGGDWIMADACEGVIDEPSMYEAGWGKKLSYVFAIGSDHVFDVTCRYTRSFNTKDFQARRRDIASSEVAGEDIVREKRRVLRARMSEKAAAELERRLQQEEKLLAEHRLLTTWDTESYGQGRLSGSLIWKIARNEAGKNGQGKSSVNPDPSIAGKSPQPQFHVESFFPLAPTISIAVYPRPLSRNGRIVVSGTKCAIGGANTLSVVVIDENYLGCILRSRAFDSLNDLAEFVETLPKYRVVAICGQVEKVDASSNEKTRLSRLGGFEPDSTGEGVLYVGQVEAQPDWAYCTSFEASPKGISIQGATSTEGLRLRTEQQTRPACVTGRLSESIMPYTTQLLASEEQKRAAFLTFVKGQQSPWLYSGYATKTGCPIYLLGESSYPFERLEAYDAWNSFLLLPPALVADDDVGIVDPGAAGSTPLFEMPVDTHFFAEHLGIELLEKQEGVSTRVSTMATLQNAKLVALYFSAHWCGPCRSFTPMLSEMYQHLKDEVPTHGLEIVFVSSDRDISGFDRYYESMPWLAIPFQTLTRYKQLLGMKYGVRGIPALVVLDSVSGEVVVTSNDSRREISQACNRGESAIEALLQNWFARISPETQEIFRMLELSCVEDRVNQSPKEPLASPVNPYLICNDEFTPSLSWEPGPLNGKAQRLPLVSDNSKEEQALARLGRVDAQAVLNTALKYLENTQKVPWSPKFRTFKLGNKVADRITRVEGGVDLICSLGFEVRGTPQDFIAAIPLAMDLDKLHLKITSMLEQEKAHFL
jgi:thiol-disulfide isomerase/thioredoxin